MKNIRFFLLSVCTILISAGGVAGSGDLHVWSDSEMKELRNLWLGSLPPLPKDASNIYDDNPRAAELGRKFFFDNRFSGNLKVSCATCHQPDMNFTDILPVAHGIGTSTRRTMPLIGVAYNSWLFWDGRKDSLWSQALGPIENPLEHGFTRTRSAAVISGHYRKEYEEIFGRMPELSLKDLPPTARPSAEDPAALKKWIFMPRTQQDEVNRIYANMGKAIGAFVRTIVPTESRFDRYIEALSKGDREQAANILSPEELKGLRLFIGKAKCTNCHNGPLFTDGDFHNIHLPGSSRFPADKGRSDALAKVLFDEFNCASIYSDTGAADCSELRFMDTDMNKYTGAFKTPTLRNVTERPPYMHAGQFSTLRKVLEFYRALPQEQRTPELEHAALNDEEMGQIEAFLSTLSAPLSSFSPNAEGPAGRQTKASPPGGESTAPLAKPGTKRAE